MCLVTTPQATSLTDFNLNREMVTKLSEIILDIVYQRAIYVI